MKKQNNESAIKVAVSEDLEKMLADCEILDDNQALVINGGKQHPKKEKNKHCTIIIVM